MPIVVRYLLETCETTEQARTTLRRLPYHLAHTLTIVDLAGDVCTAYLAPDRDVVLTTASAATNHQGSVEWHEHAPATKSVERAGCARAARHGAPRRPSVRRGLPATAALRGRRRPPPGTLYTVAYHVGEGQGGVPLARDALGQSFTAFSEGVRTVELATSSAAWHQAERLKPHPDCKELADDLTAQAVRSAASSSNAATNVLQSSIVCVIESVHSSSRPGVMKMPRFML